MRSINGLLSLRGVPGRHIRGTGIFGLMSRLNRKRGIVMKMSISRLCKGSF